MTASNFSFPVTVGLANRVGTAKGGGYGVSTAPINIYKITPAAAAANNIVAAQAIAGAANATINGALATSGVATLDVPRTIQVVSSNAADITQTVTVTGTDTFGVTVVETTTLNGTDIKYMKKAFKTVTRIAVSAAMTGNITAGTTDIFGLNHYTAGRYGDLTFWDTAFVTTGTFTAGVTTSPATATTGDVRGTYWPASASDGVKILSVWNWNENPDTNTALYGVTQYGG